MGGVVQSMRLVSRTHAACSRFIVACDRQTEWVGGRRGQAEEVSDLPTDCLTLALFILKLVVAGRGGVGMGWIGMSWPRLMSDTRPLAGWLVESTSTLTSLGPAGWVSKVYEFPFPE